jgi:hypothetical protein
MLSWILAETAGLDWGTILANGGPFALFLLLIVTDKVSTVGERDRLRAKNDQLENDNKVLNESIKDDILPPLIQINSLMKDVIRELNQRGTYAPPEARKN